MRRKWKGSRIVLPLLLSAVMVVEPVGSVAAVHAEEAVQSAETIDPAQEENVETDGQLVDDVEGERQDADTEDGAGKNGGGQENREDSESEEGGAEGSDPDDADQKDEPVENPSWPEEEAQGTEKDESDEGGAPEEQSPEEDPQEDAEPEETISGNELDEQDEEEENEALGGFAGMPSSYKLTAAQMESKKSLAAHIGEISGFVAGADYVQGEVVTQAKTQEEAEMIAKAYNAEIAKFEFGILTLKLDENDSVEHAVDVAADMELNLPAVWPNYYRYLLGEEPAAGTDTVYGDGIQIETAEYAAEGAQPAPGEPDENSYLAALSYNDAYLNPENPQYQYHHTVIGSPYAWAEGYKGQGIHVAVLDSGVQSHSDLPAVTTLNTTGDSDSVGHGTHVAGIIGARLNNGVCGAGVAPEAVLYSYNLGNIASADVLAGLSAVIANGQIDLVNMSIGGLGYVGEEEQLVEQAYNKGIAIFASAGNDGGQTYSYPACYQHVICVAATDKNNERASFSSYSNQVDISAPGVDIWSTSNTNSAGYVSKSGTSMACPVAVGEAAVILSGNSALRGKSGGARVDALEALMKNNVVKAGAGMGSGITSLPKVFGLSTASVKPAAPVIEITPDADAQTVTVTITAQSGMTIYYTTNGKNPAFKNGETDAKTVINTYAAPFTINNSAKATIKAIAVNESGVSSTVKSATYTLRPYVTGITVSGPQRVTPTKTIQLSAAVTPSYATNKKVNWELYTTKADGTQDSKVTAALEKSLGIKISTGGKVTTTKDVRPAKYVVVVTAQDDGKKSAEYNIEVIAASTVKTLKFLDQDKKVLKSITLERPTQTTYNLMDNLDQELLTADGAKLAATDFKWTSNKTDVATVSQTGVVTAKKAGKATISALADDSSGKKATITVNVTQLATGITISGPAKVARSKSAAFKATITPAATTNQKVTWEIYDADGKKIDAKENKDFAKSVGVSINASGKVATTKDARPGVYTVKAITQDSASATVEADKKQAVATITVTEGIINKISFTQTAYANVKLFRKTTGFMSGSAGKTTAQITAKIEGTNGAALSEYTVTSSSIGIVKVTDNTLDPSTGIITLNIQAAGGAAGKAKITIASTDGSNKKLVCNVTVVNPVSSITIAPSAGNNRAVAQGKSLQLKARAESENGAISNKNVTWELYTEDGNKVDAQLEKDLGVKIATNGKVTAAKNAKLKTITQDGKSRQVPSPYKVRAVSKDDSGTYGEYNIAVGECATWLVMCYDPTCNWEQAGAGYDWDLILAYPDKCFISASVKWGVKPNTYYTFGVIGDVMQGGYTVSSSNPQVLSVTYTGEYTDAGYIDLKTYGKKGSASITIKAMDGSGKQIKYNFVCR